MSSGPTRRSSGHRDGRKASEPKQAIKTGIQQHHIESGRDPASLDDLPLVQNQGIDPDLYVGRGCMPYFFPAVVNVVSTNETLPSADTVPMAS